MSMGYDQNMTILIFFKLVKVKWSGYSQEGKKKTINIKRYKKIMNFV